VNRRHKHGGLALMSAVAKGHAEILRLLLARRADVNWKTYDGNPPMLAVVIREKGALDIVRILLASGADVNAKDDHGWTVLMNAVSGPPPPPPPPPGYEADIKGDVQEEIVKTLLAKGTDLNAMVSQ